VKVENDSARGKINTYLQPNQLCYQIAPSFLRIFYVGTYRDISATFHLFTLKYREEFHMSQDHAAKFFKAVRRDEVLQNRLQATGDPQAFIKIAADRGYIFNETELENALEQLPESELAAIFNPGIGGRQRLIPR
jgi:predicted ribosomally synthesized peptide with nif11-like leader